MSLAFGLGVPSSSAAGALGIDYLPDTRLLSGRCGSFLLPHHDPRPSCVQSSTVPRKSDLRRPSLQVNVYGFGADSRGNWHHYWENNRYAGEFRKTGVHDADFEAHIIDMLAKASKIEVYRGN